MENAVKLVYQRIFYPLSKGQFFSLADLNRQIAILLESYNQYRFQHLPYTRKELFLETEKPLLGALPASSYSIRHYASWSPEFFTKKAACISREVELYIEKFIAQYSYPELGYKQAQGILSLVKIYSKERLTRACQIGLQADKFRYQIIANILKNHMDEQPEPGLHTSQIPLHSNIRGAQAYQ